MAYESRGYALGAGDPDGAIREMVTFDFRGENFDLGAAGSIPDQLLVCFHDHPLARGSTFILYAEKDEYWDLFFRFEVVATLNREPATSHPVEVFLRWGSELKTIISDQTNDILEFTAGLTVFNNRYVLSQTIPLIPAPSSTIPNPSLSLFDSLSIGIVSFGENMIDAFLTNGVITLTRKKVHNTRRVNREWTTIPT